MRTAASPEQCGCRHFYVVYTRRQANKIMRRKECRHCGRRIVTFETTRRWGGPPNCDSGVG